jgi:hypothetical protein
VTRKGGIQIRTEILAFQVLHIAFFATVHELKDPLVLGSNTLPSRVTRCMKVRQIPEKASPRPLLLQMRAKGKASIC